MALNTETSAQAVVTGLASRAAAAADFDLEDVVRAARARRRGDREPLPATDDFDPEATAKQARAARGGNFTPSVAPGAFDAAELVRRLIDSREITVGNAAR